MLAEDGRTQDGCSGWELNYWTFTSPEVLGRLGRQFIHDFISGFRDELAEKGVVVPAPDLPDPAYFAAMSVFLREKGKAVTGLKSRIEELIQASREVTARMNNLAEEEFSKKHFLARLERKESGRALLCAVAGCSGMHQDYPEKLSADQAEIVGWILSFLRDYIDIHDDVEPGDLIKYEQELSGKVDELANAGLGMFVGGYGGRMRCGDGTSIPWAVSVVLIAPLDSPRIKFDEAGTAYIDGAIPKPAPKNPGEAHVAGAEKAQQKPSEVTKADIEGLRAELQKIAAKIGRPVPVSEPPLSSSEAQRVFGLLAKLETEPTVRKAPLHTVFDFMVMKGLSGNETARRCKCSPGLISKRVKTIEERLGMKMAQLGNLRMQIVEMERTVKGDRKWEKKGGCLATGSPSG